MKKRALLVALLLTSVTACGKAEVTESAKETTTEVVTEATTEATTEEKKSEAEELGYDKTYLFATEAGAKYEIPEKFEKVDAESNQGGEWSKFEDKSTGMTIETWELQRYTRKENMLDNTVSRSADLSGDEYYESMNLDKNEDGKVRISGKLKDGRHYTEVEVLYENMYHFITFFSDEGRASLCDEIADIVDSKSEYTDAYNLGGRLPLLVFGGTYAISDEALAALTDDEVVEAINEMYAVKGFIFEDQETLDYFKEYSWYSPTIQPVDFSYDSFSETEKDNLSKLQSRVDYSPQKSESQESSGSGTRFDMVRGGYYYVPDGFENITKETYAVRYVQEWQNYDLDMHIEITDAMQIDIPVGLDEDYDMQVNSIGEENLSLNKKEADGYIVSGVKADGYVYYTKVKFVNDRYVSIQIYYPQSNSDTCNKILEDFVFSFSYE